VSVLSILNTATQHDDRTTVRAASLENRLTSRALYAPGVHRTGAMPSPEGSILRGRAGKEPPKRRADPRQRSEQETDIGRPEVAIARPHELSGCRDCPHTTSTSVLPAFYPSRNGCVVLRQGQTSHASSKQKPAPLPPRTSSRRNNRGGQQHEYGKSMKQVVLSCSARRPTRTQTQCTQHWRAGPLTTAQSSGISLTLAAFS